MRKRLMESTKKTVLENYLCIYKTEKESTREDVYSIRIKRLRREEMWKALNDRLRIQIWHFCQSYPWAYFLKHNGMT
jgi:selenocysteine lyase/cysteine desulfurase